MDCDLPLDLLLDTLTENKSLLYKAILKPVRVAIQT